MTLPRCLLFYFYLILLATTYTSHLLAQPSQEAEPANQIKIPWGFQWGENQSHVEQALQQSRTTIVERKKIGDRDALVVSGFIQRLLQQAVFYFQNDSLNEIELQYGGKNWTAEHYSDFFNQTRNNIESKYGPGHIITQQKDRREGTVETIVGYQWTQVSATLQLFLFMAEKDNDAYRIVSLHYRGF